MALEGLNGIDWSRLTHAYLLLVPCESPVEASSAVTLSWAARADELQALAAVAEGLGEGSVTGPYVTAWGTTDLSAIDPSRGSCMSSAESSLTFAPGSNDQYSALVPAAGYIGKRAQPVRRFLVFTVTEPMQPALSASPA